MKKLILAMGLSGLFVLSAQAMTCPNPSSISCTKSASGLQSCTTTDANWTYSSTSGLFLPAPGVYHFDNFTGGSAWVSGGSSLNSGFASCTYVNAQHPDYGQAQFNSTYFGSNIYADVISQGNRWTPAGGPPDFGNYTCSATSISQCPFTIHLHAKK